MKRLLSMFTVFIMMALIPLSGSAAITVKKQTTVSNGKAMASARTVTTTKKATTSYTNSTQRITAASKTSYSSPSYVSRTASTKTSYSTPVKNTMSVPNAYFYVSPNSSRNTVTGRTTSVIRTATTRTSSTKTSTTKTSSSTTTASSSSKSSTPAKVEVTSVSLNETSVNMLGEPVILIATNTPPEASQQVTWSTSNASVATVSSDGKVTPVGYGTCTITAKSDNGKVAYCTITVKTSDENKHIKEILIFDDWTELFNHYTLKDIITVYVDGVKGIVNTYSEQYLDHSGIGFVSISKGGIKEINRTSKIAEFRSTYNFSGGLATQIIKKISGIDNLLSDSSLSKTYTLDNKGNFTISNY